MYQGSRWVTSARLRLKQRVTDTHSFTTRCVDCFTVGMLLPGYGPLPLALLTGRQDPGRQAAHIVTGRDGTIAVCAGRRPPSSSPPYVLARGDWPTRPDRITPVYCAPGDRLVPMDRIVHPPSRSPWIDRFVAHYCFTDSNTPRLPWIDRFVGHYWLLKLPAFI